MKNPEHESRLWKCEYSTPKGERCITFRVAYTDFVEFQDGRLVVRSGNGMDLSVIRAYRHVFCFEPVEEAGPEVEGVHGDNGYHKCSHCGYRMDSPSLVGGVPLDVDVIEIKCPRCSSKEWMRRSDPFEFDEAGHPEKE